MPSASSASPHHHHYLESYLAPKAWVISSESREKHLVSSHKRRFLYEKNRLVFRYQLSPTHYRDSKVFFFDFTL